MVLTIHMAYIPLKFQNFRQTLIKTSENEAGPWLGEDRISRHGTSKRVKNTCIAS